MKKNAFFICSNTLGGHEFQSIELIQLSKKYGTPNVFLNGDASSSLLDHFKSVEGINCRVVNQSFFHEENFVKQYIRFFFRRSHNEYLSDFDQYIICAGTVEAGITMGLKLRKKKNLFLYVPMFVDRTKIWGNIGKIYNLLLRIFVLPYKSIVTINKYQAFFFRMKKCFILPNIIETSYPYPDTEARHDKRVYFIGRLHKQKDIINLIDWLDCEKDPYKNFLIIGDGPDRLEIENLVENLKHINVSVTGWLNKEEQSSLICQEDVLVMNSLYEGDPLVVREANDRGNVVIARDIIGHYDCTHPENRYKNKSELIELLNLAHSRELKHFENLSKDEVSKIREDVAAKIFL